MGARFANPSLLLAAIADGLRPQKRLAVSEWADAHRVLPAKGAAEKGPWRTSRNPLLREPMDALSATSRVSSVTLMFPTQLGKTEIGLNWLGYIMDHAPAPTLAVWPTEKVRDRTLIQRIKPMIAESPRLVERIEVKRTRTDVNSKDMIDFPGGVLIMGGANSPASLASMPIQNVVIDELDRCPLEVGKEGDLVGLVDERTKTFPRRKRLYISTPTIAGASLIETQFKAGDQRYYHMPCPHCSEYLVFKWPQLRWNAERTRAWYTCEHCGGEIDEHQKPAMLDAGRWIPAAPQHTARSYTANALYAPLGLGWTWLELVASWLAAQNDPARLKRFVNTSLAEAWEDRTRRKVEAHELLQRASDLPLRAIPPGCLILTAGVDVQDDRLEAHAIGHGANRRWWTVDYEVFPGDPARLEVWNDLAAWLARPFVNAYGFELHIRAAGIDIGGHHTEDVKAFAAERRAGVCRLMAVQGSRWGQGELLKGRPSKKDYTRSGRVIKQGAEVWQVGPDAAKHLIYNDLSGDADLPAAERRVGFPAGLDLAWYEQLLAEKWDPEKQRYVNKPGRRNEVLDTCVYAHAAARHPALRIDKMRAPDWARLAAVLEPESRPQGVPPSTPAAPSTGIVRRNVGGIVRRS